MGVGIGRHLGEDFKRKVGVGIRRHVAAGIRRKKGECAD